MATHPSVPSRVTSGHCSGGGLSPVGGSRWPCEDGGPLAPCPSPKASAMCCGSPSPQKPLPVPGAQRDRSKWGLWTKQGRGPLATRGHTPGGARRTGCPQAAPFRSGPVGPAASSPSRQLLAQAGLDRRPPARPGPPQPGCSSFALPPGVRGGAPGQAVAHPPGLLHLLHCLLRADSRSGSAGEAGRDRGGPRAPPTPFAHCPLSADLPVASGGIACWRRSQAPPSLTRQSGWPLGTEVPDGPWPRPPPLCRASFDCSLPAGLSIVDALPQHRVRHLLRHRTRPWAQYVPGAASALVLPPVLHHRLELPREARGGAAPSLTGVWAERT